MLPKNKNCVFSPFWRAENFVMTLDNHDFKRVVLKNPQVWISKKRIEMGGEE